MGATSTGTFVGHPASREIRSEDHHDWDGGWEDGPATVARRPNSLPRQRVSMVWDRVSMAGGQGQLERSEHRKADGGRTTRVLLVHEPAALRPHRDYQEGRGMDGGTAMRVVPPSRISIAIAIAIAIAINHHDGTRFM